MKIKKELKKMLLQKYEAYVKEAEHMDGSGFWKHFSNTEEAFEDFLRHYAGQYYTLSSK